MTKRELILKTCFVVDEHFNEMHCPIDEVEKAMDEWAKAQIVEFHVWNQQKLGEYAVWLNSNSGIPIAKWEEIKTFEKATIGERYEMFLKTKP